MSSVLAVSLALSLNKSFLKGHCFLNHVAVRVEESKAAAARDGRLGKSGSMIARVFMDLRACRCIVECEKADVRPSIGLLGVVLTQMQGLCPSNRVMADPLSKIQLIKVFLYESQIKKFLLMANSRDQGLIKKASLKIFSFYDITTQITLFYM